MADGLALPDVVMDDKTARTDRITDPYTTDVKVLQSRRCEE
jgi:hypothetical protein